ncbi:MAG: PDZ domain-containing protein [Hyphomicrobiales bacterium]
MQSSNQFGRFGGSVALGAALLALVAMPLAARADDSAQWDWQSSGKSKDKTTWKSDDDGGGAWVQKGNDGSVRVYRYRTNQPAASSGGYFGVQVQDVTPRLKRAKDLQADEGALVNDVEDGSPADDAGIQVGDVILSVDGKDIGGSRDLIEVVRDLDPGDNTRVEIERDGARKTVTVKVGERPRMMRMTPPTPPRGMMQWRQDGSDDNSAPFMMFQQHRQNMDELNDQLKDLQKQIDQLTEELRGLREDLRRLDSSRTRVR